MPRSSKADRLASFALIERFIERLDAGADALEKVTQDTADTLPVTPNQPTTLRATISAKPSLHPLRLAMAVEAQAAPATSRLPTAFGHFGLPAPYRPGSDFHALPFPDRIVGVPRADERMGDFVEDCVQDLLAAVALREIGRKLDGTPLVNAQAQRPFPAVEGERPVVQAMESQKVQSQLADFLEALTGAGSRYLSFRKVNRDGC